MHGWCERRKELQIPTKSFLLETQRSFKVHRVSSLSSSCPRILKVWPIPSRDCDTGSSQELTQSQFRKGTRKPMTAKLFSQTKTGNGHSALRRRQAQSTVWALSVKAIRKANNRQTYGQTKHRQAPMLHDKGHRGGNDTDGSAIDCFGRSR